MDRPDHTVFWIECVAPGFDEIVKIRPVQVWCSVHLFLLLLAPAFRHRKVEGDRDFARLVSQDRSNVLHLHPHLITESAVVQNRGTLHPLVTLSHPRLRNRSHGNLKRHW